MVSPTKNTIVSQPLIPIASSRPPKNRPGRDEIRFWLTIRPSPAREYLISIVVISASSEMLEKKSSVPSVADGALKMGAVIKYCLICVDSEWRVDPA